MATTTVYPDAGTGSTTVDGRIYENPGSGTFSTSRNSTNGDGADATSTFENIVFTALQTGRYDIHRYFATLDTSSIADTDTINSATFSIYKDSATNTGDVNTTTVELVQTSPAANNTLATTDFDNLTFTSGGSLAIASFTTGAYNDITLNATGLTWISKTGITKLGLITGLDLNATTPTGWNSPGNLRTADYAGTTSDPKIAVVHVAAAVATDALLIGHFA